MLEISIKHKLYLITPILKLQMTISELDQNI